MTNRLGSAVGQRPGWRLSASPERSATILELSASSVEKIGQPTAWKASASSLDSHRSASASGALNRKLEAAVSGVRIDPYGHQPTELNNKFRRRPTY